jgi:hypothetical protein
MGTGTPVPRSTCGECGEYLPHACAPVVLITREKWTGRRIVAIRDREQRQGTQEIEAEAGA